MSESTPKPVEGSTGKYEPLPGERSQLLFVRPVRGKAWEVIYLGPRGHRHRVVVASIPLARRVDQKAASIARMEEDAHADIGALVRARADLENLRFQLDVVTRAESMEGEE